MASIEVYHFEDENGREQGWTTRDPRKAEEHARRNGFKCIAIVYEFADSEVVWDFTKGGSDASSEAQV